MGCAAVLQSLKLHLGLLGAMPPRMGRARWRVAFEGMERDERVGGTGELDAVRCLPAWTRRRELSGAVVRRDSRWMSVGMGVSEGIWKGMVSPDGSLTKICWLGESGVEVVDAADVADVVEDERDRIINQIWKVLETLVACAVQEWIDV